MFKKKHHGRLGHRGFALILLVLILLTVLILAWQAGRARAAPAADATVAALRIAVRADGLTPAPPPPVP